MTQVCKTLRDIANDDWVWYGLTMRNFFKSEKPQQVARRLADEAIDFGTFDDDVETETDTEDEDEEVCDD